MKEDHTQPIPAATNEIRGNLTCTCKCSWTNQFFYNSSDNGKKPFGSLPWKPLGSCDTAGNVEGASYL